MELDTKPEIGDSKRVKLHDSPKKDTGYVGPNLYKTPPFGQLTLEECEDLFRQRIEALTAIDSLNLSNKDGDIIASTFREIKSYLYKTNCLITRAGDAQQRKLDHFSHMLVRLYCIYHPDLWDWFRRNEKKLLNYRLREQVASMLGSDFDKILKSLNFDSTRVQGTELNNLYKEHLISSDKEGRDIFKVHFKHALRFVARRAAPLKDGFAYLTKNDIIQVVCDVFGKHLDKELVYARQHLNIELLQTQQLLDSLAIVYADYADKIEDEKMRKKKQNDGDQKNPYRIDIDNLEKLSKDHFPPCIRYTHEALMQDNHLKHSARLIYGTFLRSGGVDMESSIEFWRREFTKKIPNDKFDRYYKYNIRHLYGGEGHKKALSCFSCDKIINDMNPGPSEKHGCPFKHFDETHLRKMLQDHNLKNVDIETVVSHTKEKDYKIACGHYFKALKGDFPTELIRNPIHFYYESMRIANRPPPPPPPVEKPVDEEIEWQDDFEIPAKIDENLN